MQISTARAFFFGLIISKDGFKPDPGKIADIVIAPIPSSATKLEAFWVWQISVPDLYQILLI